jgi:hypothetical protein
VEYEQSGIYNQTFPIDGNCDSIVTLYLTIKHPSTTNIVDFVCQGTSYQKNGFNILEDQNLTPGTTNYQRFADTTSICPNIYNLSLTVDAVFETQIFDTIVKGMHYIYNGFNITNTNTEGTFNYDFTQPADNGCDSTVYLTLTVVAGTGFENFNIERQLVMYPNPAKDRIYISSSETIKIQQIEITDMQGALLQNQIASNEHVIDVNLNNFAQGVYFIKIYTDHGIIAKKLIIQK